MRADYENLQQLIDRRVLFKWFTYSKYSEGKIKVAENSSGGQHYFLLHNLYKDTIEPFYLKTMDGYKGYWYIGYYQSLYLRSFPYVVM